MKDDLERIAQELERQAAACEPEHPDPDIPSIKVSLSVPVPLIKMSPDLARFSAAAIRALAEIRRDQGKVCQGFELCVHDACRSSYSSWVIADQALALARELVPAAATPTEGRANVVHQGNQTHVNLVCSNDHDEVVTLLASPSGGYLVGSGADWCTRCGQERNWQAVERLLDAAWMSREVAATAKEEET